MPRAIDVLNAHPSKPFLLSKERRGPTGAFIPVSNSELRRWFDRNGVQMDGKIVKFDEDVSLFVDIVLFPKSGRITLGCIHDSQNMLLHFATEYNMDIEQATMWWHGNDQ